MKDNERQQQKMDKCKDYSLAHQTALWNVQKDNLLAIKRKTRTPVVAGDRKQVEAGKKNILGRRKRIYKNPKGEKLDTPF